MRDLVLKGGRILTFDAEQSVVEAAAVRGGYIKKVGSDADCLSVAHGDAQVLELQGATVIPGLVDPHLHLAQEAAFADAVELRDLFDLDNVQSVRDILQRLRARRLESASAGGGAWIIGKASPMQGDRLLERRWPSKEELDQAIPDQPCHVTFGAHVTIANSEALRRAGITDETQDPPGGTIERYPYGSAPNGVLREKAKLLMPRPSDEVDDDYLRRSLRLELEKCLRRGVTTIHDIVRYRKEVGLYQDLRGSGELPIRVHMIVRVIEAEFPSDSLISLGLRPGFGDSLLRLGGVKMSIDGGVTAERGYFHEHPDDAQKPSSLIRIEQEELDDVIAAHHLAGIRACVHAIGDGATDMALTAFERAISQHGPRQVRHRIEHMGNWLCSPSRLAQAKRMGLSPVPNPSLMHYLGEQIERSLGKHRLVDCFPFRTLLNEGFPLVFGSDGPSYWPANPLRDIGTAVVRRSRLGQEFYPEQQISVMEGLRAQTATAAWLGMVENQLGSIEPGKLCDVAILADDPLAVAPERLGDIDIVATIVGGEIAYAAESVD